MKSRYLKVAIPLLEKEIPDKAQDIKKDARTFLDEYIRENINDPKALKTHTEGQIFPLLALQRAMEKNGFTREEAYNWLYHSMDVRCVSAQKMLQNTARHFNLWKKVPPLFIKLGTKMFGEAAGFRFNIHIATKERAKFDMTACPYKSTFTRYGYPELTKICCHSDDLTYGHIHPNLVWNRTKTLGNGDDCCDFDIFWKDHE